MRGFEHRIGGLEKSDIEGRVSYEPKNHARMVRLRNEKVHRIIQDIPPTEVIGEPDGDVLVVGWGSTYGAIMSAVERMRRRGEKVSYVHLRYIHPFPPDLGQILRRFKTILVPELNLGQLKQMLQGEYTIPIVGLNKVQGRPFTIAEIEEKIEELR
jgi:2-oxoglutarate ferredoxin oxidoreductase subunit alpha